MFILISDSPVKFLYSTALLDILSLVIPQEIGQVLGVSQNESAGIHTDEPYPHM